MSNKGTENLSNIRTVKAFADEEMTSLRFQLASQELFDYGRAKGYIRCLFFFTQRILANLGDVMIVLIIRSTFQDFGLSIGDVTAVFLYVRTLMLHASIITNNLFAMA